MTVKNLGAYFFNYGDPDTVTVHSRKNGSNGNLTCSIGSSNALGQDTSHSDSVAVGDDYDFSFAGQGNGSPGSGNMITVDYAIDQLYQRIIAVFSISSTLLRYH